MAEQPLTDWNSGLFDCCDDTQTCCYGWWCGTCLACTVSEQFGENRCLPLCDMYVNYCGSPAALSVRVAMRYKYGIKGSLCKDIAVSMFCAKCSWCQMHRELKYRKDSPNLIYVLAQTVNSQPPPMRTVSPPAGFNH
ncbi:cornifelin homolog B-like [Fundulus diaphanus]